MNEPRAASSQFDERHGIIQRRRSFRWPTARPFGYEYERMMAGEIAKRRPEAA